MEPIVLTILPIVVAILSNMADVITVTMCTATAANILMQNNDIGYMLTAEEKILINNIEIDEYNETESDAVDKYLFDKEICKMNKIFSSKRERNRNTQKYNQLFVEREEEKIKDNINSGSDNMYSSGYLFKYGYDGEIEYDEFGFYDNAITVTPKYLSLKEELTTNDIAIARMEQFNSEYKKSQIHFNSKYCKVKFRPLDSYPPDQFKEIECLLSLMIYCNYDGLQYEFSKTYREQNGVKHNEFYWLGKYRKISVHKFGQSLKEREMNKVYHGINGKLL